MEGMTSMNSVTAHDIPQTDVTTLIQPERVLQLDLRYAVSPGYLYRLTGPLLGWELDGDNLVPVTSDAHGDPFALTARVVIVHPSGAEFAHSSRWAELDVDGTYSWTVLEGGAA